MSAVSHVVKLGQGIDHIQKLFLHSRMTYLSTMKMSRCIGYGFAMSGADLGFSQGWGGGKLSTLPNVGGYGVRDRGHTPVGKVCDLGAFYCFLWHLLR